MGMVAGAGHAGSKSQLGAEGWPRALYKGCELLYSNMATRAPAQRRGLRKGIARDRQGSTGKEKKLDAQGRQEIRRRRGGGA
eukprot:scaffold5901_cov90-Isochrysis_galbana.AAC.1